MPINSKIFIASKPVFWPSPQFDTTKDHLYLVYDLDGDINDTSDQYIIRGGPEDEKGAAIIGAINNIKLEVNFPIGSSLDNFSNDYGMTTASRNYREITALGSRTVDAVWDDLKAFASSMSNASGNPEGVTDVDGRLITNMSLLHTSRLIRQR